MLFYRSNLTSAASCCQCSGSKTPVSATFVCGGCEGLFEGLFEGLLVLFFAGLFSLFGLVAAAAGGVDIMGGKERDIPRSCGFFFKFRGRI